MSLRVKVDSLTYPVADDSEVSVRIVIGDAQAGGWIVAWDKDHVVAKGEDPDLISIGKGKDVRNRTLQIRATAVDVRADTNRLSSTLTVDGGTEGAKKLVHRYDDGDAGDAALFATAVRFT